jgi:hypothetical protein
MDGHSAKNSTGQTGVSNGPTFGWPSVLPPAYVMLSHGRAEENDRISRLRQLAVPIARSAPDTFERLLRLHDHKGVLEVHWRVMPSSFDWRLVNFLWAEQAEPLVLHFVGGRFIRGSHADDPTPLNWSGSVGLTILGREEACRLYSDIREPIL